MASFFAMGGYAAYVWPAFGISFVVLMGLVWASVRAYFREQNTLARLEREEEQSKGRFVAGLNGDAS